MTSITRAATPRDLPDLLASARFAIVAWNRDGRIAAEPVPFLFTDGRYCIGLVPATLAEHAEVAVLVDDGPLYFDLRGARISYLCAERGPDGAVPARAETAAGRRHHPPQPGESPYRCLML